MLQNQNSSARKKSYVIAILFIIIAVIGVWMKLSSPSAEQNQQKPTTTKPQTTIQSDSSKTDSSAIQFKSDSTNFSNYNRSQSSYTGGIIKTIVVAVLFIMLVTIGLIIFKKKFSASKTFGMDMDILGKKYFGQKQFLLLVRVEDQKLLIGVTDNNINLIKDFGAMSAEEQEEMRSEMSPDEEQSFPKIIRKISFNKD